MALYDVIGEQNYPMLLADPQGAELIGIPCEPGNGVVERGTVMYRKDTGLWAPAATANVVATNMLVVLNEKVDTTGLSDGEGKMIAEDAAAYRAGRFVEGTVKLAAGAALTAAHKVILRGQNIVFDQKVSTATFNNVK